MRREVSLKALEYGKLEEAAKGTVRQVVTLKAGISSDYAKKINVFIKDMKLKGVNSQTQGDQVRVSGKKRDDLQQVIAALKADLRMVAAIEPAVGPGLALGVAAVVTLALDSPVTLPEGTVARIANMGLLGDKYVVLEPGPEGAPPLSRRRCTSRRRPVAPSRWHRDPEPRHHGRGGRRTAAARGERVSRPQAPLNAGSSPSLH